MEWTYHEEPGGGALQVAQARFDVELVDLFRVGAVLKSVRGLA